MIFFCWKKENRKYKFAYPLFPSGWDAGLQGALVLESPLFGITTKPGLEPGLGRPGLLYPDRFECDN